MRVPLFEGRALPIFPVRRSDKRPLSPHGFHDATADYEPWPSGALPAVPTGEASGIDVLDVDPAGLGWLDGVTLPPTRVHSTPRGGFHYLFQATPDLRCSTSRIAPGVDVRASGGYAVWWPGAGLPVQGHEVAEWPEWLLALARGSEKQKTVGTKSTAEAAAESPVPMVGLCPPTPYESNYAEKSLRNAFAEMCTCAPGSRNDKLNKLAYSMGRQVARGWVSRVRVEKGLALAARECRLGSEEARKTIASGLRAGMLEPYPDIAPEASS